MTDRICVRGCMQRGVHWAHCPDYGATTPECPGCVPRECPDGSLWCTACFGRARALLRDITDLCGRLTALADPLKASPLDQVRVRVSGEPPAAVPSDLLDALAVVQQMAEWAYADLSAVSNDLDTVTYLGAMLLDRHPPVDGVRAAWSVQDAVDTWGVERRDTPTVGIPHSRVLGTPDPVYDEDTAAGIPESGFDPLIASPDAAKLVHITERTLRRWVEAGELEPRARLRQGRKVTAYYYRSEVLAAAARADESRHAARPPQVLDSDVHAIR